MHGDFIVIFDSSSLFDVAVRGGVNVVDGGSRLSVFLCFSRGQGGFVRSGVVIWVIF